MSDLLDFCTHDFYISIPLFACFLTSIGMNIYFICAKKTQKEREEREENKESGESYLELQPIKGELPRWVVEDYKKQIEKKSKK